MTEYSLILCIVNSGFADEVMVAAREKGATGGTVFSGRGTVREEAENLFGITVHPEKDIVMIIVKNEIKDDILKNLYEKVGLNSDGHGIAFSLPVEEVAGLMSDDLKKKIKQSEQNN